MTNYDFTNCKIGNRDYGGSDSKESIIYNDKFFMLKFSDHLNKI